MLTAVDASRWGGTGAVPLPGTRGVPQCSPKWDSSSVGGVTTRGTGCCWRLVSGGQGCCRSPAEPGQPRSDHQQRALPWLGGRPCPESTCSLPFSARQALGVDLGVALPPARRPAPSSLACWVRVFTGWPESSEGTGDLGLDPSTPPYRPWASLSSPSSGRAFLFLWNVPWPSLPCAPAHIQAPGSGLLAERTPSPRPESGGRGAGSRSPGSRPTI